MNAIEWVLWLGVIWAVFFLYCAFDIPSLLQRGRWSH